MIAKPDPVAAIVDAVAVLQDGGSVVLGDIVVYTGLRRSRVTALMPQAVALSVEMYPGKRLVVTEKNLYRITDEFSWDTAVNTVRRLRKAATATTRAKHETAVNHPLAHLLRLSIEAAEAQQALVEQIAAMVPKGIES